MIFSTISVPAFEHRPDKSRESSRIWEREGFGSLDILRVIEFDENRRGSYGDMFKKEGNKGRETVRKEFQKFVVVI